MEGDLEETDLVAFIENFPFPSNEDLKNEQNQEEYIFNLLKEICKTTESTSFDNNDNTTTENEESQQDDDEKINIYDKEYEEYISDKPIIKRMCDQLAMCYSGKNLSYDRIFSLKCKEDSLDDDLMEEELKSNVNECNLTTFDDNFPFPNSIKQDKFRQERYVFNFLQAVYRNPDITSFHVPEFMLLTEYLKNMFKIDKEELEGIVMRYKKQCPLLYNGINNDMTCFYLLAIGAAMQNYPYLTYLVDDFNRRRIEASNNNEQVYKKEKWLKENQHAKILTTSNIKIDAKTITEIIGTASDDKKNDEMPGTANDLIGLAILLFGRRVCAPFKLNPIQAIDDSLEITARYLEAITGFIHAILKVNKYEAAALCPFQLDFCLVFSNAIDMANKGQMNQDDDDEADDDEKDNDDINADYIGDIKAKLEKNGLKYVTQKVKSDVRPKHFRQLLTKFKEKYSLNTYPHQQRFMIMVDRRQSKTQHDDIMYLYESPPNCRYIPKQAVPEWGFSASKTCLLLSIIFYNLIISNLIETDFFCLDQIWSMAMEKKQKTLIQTLIKLLIMTQQKMVNQEKNQSIKILAPVITAKVHY